MMERRYVGFEGPLAAGKTTLAQLLGKHLRARLILEDVAGNEFLADFYVDKPRWGLGMQLSYLLSRHGQLKTVSSARSETIVADYTPAKDGIFAGMLLVGRELRLYEGISKSLNFGVVRPDLTVYLDAENRVLLERIRHRGRAYEAKVDGNYLNAVREAYEKEFRRIPGINLLRFDTSVLDLSSQPQLAALYERINSAA